MTQAKHIVHWPGKDVPACDEHARSLHTVAGVMGFSISMTPCEEETECTNCKNAERKEGI